MDFEALNKKILPPDAQAEKAAWAHWDGIAKPLRGLGRLGTAEEKYPEGGKPSGTECPAAEADGAVPGL